MKQLQHNSLDVRAPEREFRSFKGKASRKAKTSAGNLKENALVRQAIKSPLKTKIESLNLYNPVLMKGRVQQGFARLKSRKEN